MAADDAALQEQKLRAIRELMQVRADLLSALQGRDGSAAQRLPPPPLPAPPAVAPLQRRVSVEELLQSADATAGDAARGFERYSTLPPPSNNGSPYKGDGGWAAGGAPAGGSVPGSPSGARRGGSGTAQPQPAGAGGSAAWAAHLSTENAALQRALREAQAAQRAAEAAAASAREQADANAAQMQQQAQQLADATRHLADVGGLQRDREAAALRDQVLQLQSELELERVLRARAESEAALSRSALAAAAPGAPQLRAPAPPPRREAVFGDGGVLAPDFVPSFAELPPAGHWTMGADGGIWYLHPKHGAWRQAADGSFGRSAEAPPPARRGAAAAAR